MGPRPPPSLLLLPPLPVASGPRRSIRRPGACGDGHGHMRRGCWSVTAAMLAELAERSGSAATKAGCLSRALPPWNAPIADGKAAAAAPPLRYRAWRAQRCGGAGTRPRHSDSVLPFCSAPLRFFPSPAFSLFIACLSYSTVLAQISYSALFSVQLEPRLARVTADTSP